MLKAAANFEARRPGEFLFAPFLCTFDTILQDECTTLDRVQAVVRQISQYLGI